MNIFILRHGIAVEPGAPGIKTDAERPLVPKGEQRLRAAVAAMEKMDLSFDAIISSPYLRAKETAEIVAKHFKLEKKLAFSGDLIPGGNPQALIRQLNDLKTAPENILLVGHEPYLSRLIALLATGNPGATIEMKKGGLCKLEAEELEYGHCATLKWLLTPGQMELMA
ncbi:MAG TPA: phosphohistidine phosphatase SixA [Verrucomicrobiae bacterium]|jgi:phosphohistidine phosphatase